MSTYQLGNVTIAVEESGDDSLNVYSSVGEGPRGRFLEIKSASSGTGVELYKPGSITTGTGLTTDANGRAVYQDA